jgi:tRNA-specific 2-thiouridylase
MANVDHLSTSSHKPKVALGMSGGVDSSVCAHLLLEQGYDVTGVFLECWRAPGCRSEEDRQDALKVALALNIPFQVLDFKDAYKSQVVEYFFREYEAGRTPNPDVMCNKEVKFGLFYDWAMDNGFDLVATGHYAKTEENHGHTRLLTPIDEHKDQTYFLYLLRPEQLPHIIFPLGDLTKQQVRLEASKRQIHVATKKDSVGICFIGDINVHNFLKERLGEKPGEVIDTAGHVIGQHQGLWFYTIGQRHGFTIQPTSLIAQSDGSTISKHNVPPFYVIGKKPATNQLVVGFGAETYQQEFVVRDLNWLEPKPSLNHPQLVVRIRHTGALLPCTVTSQTDSTLSIRLATGVQGLAEGQSAVLYVPKTASPHLVCLGGGVIALADQV